MKLTPEKYLTYPVAPVHAIACTAPGKQEYQNEDFTYKFRNGNIPPHRRFVECLRFVRLETLDADSDFENLTNAWALNTAVTVGTDLIFVDEIR